MPQPNEDERVHVRVDGRRLTLSNLDKVLYPDSGTTKAEVLTYVAEVAPALLRQLADRPVTRVRWPQGTGGDSFFEKNLPPSTPSWIRRFTPAAGEKGTDRTPSTYPLVEDLAGLTWLTNLACLELHTPQWRVGPDGVALPPDRVVVDLDPGAPAGLTECAQVALWIREKLTRAGLHGAVPVTSGGKGLQVYASFPPGSAGSSPTDPMEFVGQLARDLERERGELVVASISKSRRVGKVLIDWAQNSPTRTTICPYSLRGRRGSPTVAAPRTWSEIEEGARYGELWQATPEEVCRRLSQDGDLMVSGAD